MIMHESIKMCCIFLRKTSIKRRVAPQGAIQDQHLVIYCQSFQFWVDCVKLGLDNKEMASIFQPGFHRLQDNIPCKQDSCLCFRQCHSEFVGWAFGFSLWGVWKKKGEKRQEFPEIWINVWESEVTQVLILVPTKAAGETFLSNPHLKAQRRALHQQGQLDGVILWCQEPWCHEIFIQGLINV